MKTKSLLAVLGVLLFGGAALAVVPWTNINLNQWVKGKLYIGPKSEVGTTGNYITKALGASATVNFASTTVGTIESSAITVTGAAVGDPCFVGVPDAAGALAAQYSCYVSAADEVKIKFDPQSRQVGTTMLDGGSPSQIDVTGITASSKCLCSSVGTSAAIAGGSCAVSLTSTTLTITSADTLTNNVNYECVAPVDPASGTFYVRVISSQ